MAEINKQLDIHPCPNFVHAFSSVASVQVFFSGFPGKVSQGGFIDIAFVLKILFDYRNALTSSIDISDDAKSAKFGKALSGLNLTAEEHDIEQSFTVKNPVPPIFNQNINGPKKVMLKHS